MKKLILSAVVIGAISLTSCGGKMSACDCLKAAEEMVGKAIKAGTDNAKIEAITEEAKAIDAKCKGYKLEDYKGCR
jgi:hypothetical protein